MKVQVLLPKIFNFTFTYAYEQKNNYKIGDIVEVPFGSKTEIGVIWSGLSAVDKKIKIKNIKKRIENYSLSKKLIQFIDWFSMYNMVPRGLVLKMCIGSNENFFKKNEEKIKNKITHIEKYLLNQQQKVALKYLEKNSSNFNVSVLQGVTGSGKTLVYFERIKKFILKKK